MYKSPTLKGLHLETIFYKVCTHVPTQNKDIDSVSSHNLSLPIYNPFPAIISPSDQIWMARGSLNSLRNHTMYNHLF